MTQELKLVLNDIKNHKIFKDNDFRLVGGTALAFHINHRLSEDLDFFIDGKLPVDDIGVFIKSCQDFYGREKVHNMPASQNRMYEIENSDEDIHNIQQDWNINGVKITFCDASSNVGIADIFNNDNPTMLGNIKISSVDSIFKMKSLMFYKRVKIRDYFDLETLYQNNNNTYTPKQTLSLIQKYEIAFADDSQLPLFFIMLDQKIKGYQKETDAPLATLIENAPDFKSLSNAIYSKLKNI